MRHAPRAARVHRARIDMPNDVVESWLRYQDDIFPQPPSVSGGAGFRVFRGKKNEVDWMFLTTENMKPPSGDTEGGRGKNALRALRLYFRTIILDLRKLHVGTFRGEVPHSG